MSRTRRLREEVLNLLEDKGTANTVEIFDHLNDRFRWGATMNQVGNIMAKDNRFSRSGTSEAHSEEASILFASGDFRIAKSLLLLFRGEEVKVTSHCRHSW